VIANQKRARQARCALKAYGRNRQELRRELSPDKEAWTEEAITDLVADLYHLAQAENIEVEVIARQAMAHFKAELIADTSADDLSDRTIPNAFPPA
jgi:hypothetical protein